jgi:3-oxoacyl-(acyl-carrier-protein) synthase
MNHSHTLMMEAINKERDGFVMGEGTSVLVWIVDIMFLNI